MMYLINEVEDIETKKCKINVEIEEKHTTLLIDEMAIKPSLHYDNYTCNSGLFFSDEFFSGL